MSSSASPRIGGFLPRPEESPDLVSSDLSYAGRFSGSLGAWFLDVQSEALRAMVHPLGGGVALDIGGGHGQIAHTRIEQGHSVTILGSSEDSFARVRTLFPQDDIAFTVGSLVAPPFPERSFDLVSAFRILTHVERWREMLRAMCRIARRAIVIDFASWGSVNLLAPSLFFLKRRVEGDARPFNLIRVTELNEVLSECGFHWQKSFAQYCLPMALHRAVDRPVLSRRIETWLRQAGVTDRVGSPIILCASREPVPGFDRVRALGGLQP